MIWITTRRIITTMANNFAFFNRTKGQLICKSVSTYIFTIYPKSTIIRTSSPTDKLPTSGVCFNKIV